MYLYQVWSDYLEGVASDALNDDSCPIGITVPPTGHPSFTSVDSWDLRTRTNEPTGEYISRILNELDAAGDTYIYSSDQCTIFLEMEDYKCSRYKRVGIKLTSTVLLLIDQKLHSFSTFHRVITVYTHVI